LSILPLSGTFESQSKVVQPQIAHYYPGAVIRSGNKENINTSSVNIIKIVSEDDDGLPSSRENEAAIIIRD
jgi:hypothetical protein